MLGLGSLHTQRRKKKKEERSELSVVEYKGSKECPWKLLELRGYWCRVDKREKESERKCVKQKDLACLCLCSLCVEGDQTPLGLSWDCLP